MGLAMVAIVLFHHSFTIIPGITAVFSRFGLWGVDTFLFLSGFGCVYALDKYSTGVFLQRRVWRLLPTCVIAGIFVCVADIYFNAERTNTYLPLRLLSLNRWYIQAIIICYAICPIADIVIKRFGAYGLMCIALICIVPGYFSQNIGAFRIRWILERIPVFLVGMYIAIFDLKMSKMQYVLSALCLLAAIVTRCRGGYYLFQWTYFLAAAMPFVCEMLCRLKNLCIKMRILRPIEILGAYSLEIYLIHEYAYWAIGKSDIPLWLKYAAFIMIVCGLCILTKKLASLVSLRANPTCK